jgi:hypothetical protein
MFCDLGFSQQVLRTISKDLSCRSQGYLPISADEQCPAHFGFQPLYLFGERRLADAQLFRSLTEVEMVGQHQEGMQFRQFECHASRLSEMDKLHIGQNDAEPAA